MTRQKKDKTSSLLVVLSGRDHIHREVLTNLPSFSDHAAYICPADLVPQPYEGSCFLNGTASNLDLFLDQITGKLDNISLAASNGTVRQLNTILAALEDKLAPDADIWIGGFRVSGKQFRQLTTRFGIVQLDSCFIGRGWWCGESDRTCEWLSFARCKGVQPPLREPGMASWANLHMLFIYGPDCPQVLRRKNRIYEDSIVDRRATEEFDQIAITAFWGGNLRSIDVHDLESVDYMADLPALPSLREIDLKSVVSPGVFQWITQHKRLRRIGMNWHPDTKLPWALLGRLKHLRMLDLTESPLNDLQLREIASVAAPICIWAFYTKLTSASWSVILSWPGLKQFWGSQELVGELPADLPETSQLDEFVALNARMEWFHSFLSAYPNIKVVEM